MRIFLTGATGFIGTAVTQDLLAHGHTVLGLARSDEGAASLKAAGADVQRGSLEGLKSLTDGAARSDAVIHTAFIHDFSKFQENCEIDRKAIGALAAGLKGSKRPLVITSGTGMGNSAPGQSAREDHFDPQHPNPRRSSELAGVAAGQEGVHVSVVRLPQVHNREKAGLVTYLVDLAKQKGVSAYVGDGLNRWPAGHLLDVAPLYRLAAEKGEAGARYHAVGEEGVTARSIAGSLGRGLKIPTVSLSSGEAAAHFGWLAMFVGMDMPASSALTQERLGWRPTHGGLIADLDRFTAFGS